jgi:crotonobetainyl-CoA:carnitine CoA-transferase CaiB-like acyl-CoA transferase
MTAGPLARFTVLDLTRVRAGPTAVRYLADWGANCIKVEMPPGAGDMDMGGPRHGPDFQNLHRNKRSITLNLKEPNGGCLPEAGREGRRGGRELPRRREVPARHRLREPQEA